MVYRVSRIWWSSFPLGKVGMGPQVLGRGFGLLEMTLAGSYLLIREHVPIDT